MYSRRDYRPDMAATIPKRRADDPPIPALVIHFGDDQKREGAKDPLDTALVIHYGKGDPK